MIIRGKIAENGDKRLRCTVEYKTTLTVDIPWYAEFEDDDEPIIDAALDGLQEEACDEDFSVVDIESYVVTEADEYGI